MLVPTMRDGWRPCASRARATPRCAQPRAPPPPSASVKPSPKADVIGSGRGMLGALARRAQLGVREEPGVVAVAPDRRQGVTADPAHLGELGLAIVERCFE